MFQLAYKKIRNNWTDIHSGTFDNSIGAVCGMPRNMVDEDSSRTCSAGLHVCSYDYLAHFSKDKDDREDEHFFHHIRHKRRSALQYHRATYEAVSKTIEHHEHAQNDQKVNGHHQK